MSSFFLNPRARSDKNQRGLFEPEEYVDVESFFRGIPGLHPTPLHRLPALARDLAVGTILLKDESDRFGLNAFKILGVSYAVGRLLQSGRLHAGDVVVCATEGNHGRAVARAARDHHLIAKVFLPSSVSSPRRQAIASEGAQVIIVEGSYEEAVRRAARESERNGWLAVSDTSWPGYEEIPRLIMAGYTHLMAEAKAQWGADEGPDVVLVQAGVGGLAAAVLSWFCRTYGPARPFVVVCEPSGAACVLASAQRGRPVALKARPGTIMSGLDCGEVSPLAWPTLAASADGFVAIDDEWARQAMRRLARPRGTDPPVTAGESGACGLAALMAMTQDPTLRAVVDAARLGPLSRVFVINTEGATDAERYAAIVG